MKLQCCTWIFQLISTPISFFCGLERFTHNTCESWCSSSKKGSAPINISISPGLLNCGSASSMSLGMLQFTVSSYFYFKFKQLINDVSIWNWIEMFHQVVLLLDAKCLPNSEVVLWQWLAKLGRFSYCTIL